MMLQINLSNEESKKSYQCKSYRHFAPDITFEKDLAAWPPARLDQGMMFCLVEFALWQRHLTHLLRWTLQALSFTNSP